MTPPRRAMAASVMAELRREGNEYFQAGRYAEALAAYARALDLPEAGPEVSQRALLYRNRAACHLKLVSGARRGGAGRSGGSVFLGFPSAAFPSQEDYAQAEADASRGERPPPASPAASASAPTPSPTSLPFALAQLWSWTGMT